MAADREALSSDLRFLLEEKEVPEDVQDALATRGYTNMGRSALLDDTRSGVRTTLSTDFGLDPAAQLPDGVATA